MFPPFSISKNAQFLSWHYWTSVWELSRSYFVRQFDVLYCLMSFQKFLENSFWLLFLLLLFYLRFNYLLGFINALVCELILMSYSCFRQCSFINFISGSRITSCFLRVRYSLFSFLGFPLLVFIILALSLRVFMSTEALTILVLVLDIRGRRCP